VLTLQDTTLLERTSNLAHASNLDILPTFSLGNLKDLPYFDPIRFRSFPYYFLLLWLSGLEVDLR
jgi:hypothetical protein